jgi:hypothetical protein
LAAHERQVHAGEGPAGLLPGAIVARRDGVATRPAAALERDRVRRRKEAAARARANRPAEG